MNVAVLVAREARSSLLTMYGHCCWRVLVKLASAELSAAEGLTSIGKAFPYRRELLSSNLLPIPGRTAGVPAER